MLSNKRLWLPQTTWRNVSADECALRWPVSEDDCHPSPSSCSPPTEHPHHHHTQCTSAHFCLLVCLSHGKCLREVHQSSLWWPGPGCHTAQWHCGLSGWLCTAWCECPVCRKQKPHLPNTSQLPKYFTTYQILHNLPNNKQQQSDMTQSFVACNNSNCYELHHCKMPCQTLDLSDPTMLLLFIACPLHHHLGWFWV